MPKVTVSITDPLLKTASLMKDAMGPGANRTPLLKDAPNGANRKQLLEDALNLVSKVEPKTDPESVAPLRKAEILLLLDRQLDAIAAYREALKARNIIETRIKLVELLIKTKQPDDAKKELQEAEKMAIPSSQIAYTISSFYTLVKDTDKAREWAKKGGQIAEREKERRSEQFGAAVPGASAPVQAKPPVQTNTPKK
jgi:tetratricopeptide (TPR) repeat protein